MSGEHGVAIQVVESLRKGLPPQRGVGLYSVGTEKLIDGIQKHHLSGIADRGIIRFMNGSWGSGKTHFFRVLREVAFRQNCLVSSVELNVNDAALNRFESVFYSIVRNVMTPVAYSEHSLIEAAPFGEVLREALAYLATGEHDILPETLHDHYLKAVECLMTDHGIDIDFKKIVQKYWETYLPEAPEIAVQEQIRAELLQWFSGDGYLSDYRKRYGINKMVSKDNAKLMLQSLATFVRLAGYQGLVILFDEAEQAYSVMRQSALRAAHNNLLSLINNIESLNGLFLIYATTPDFFSDPKHGIVAYGALAGRIGKPEQRTPRALDVIWNLDAVDMQIADYQNAAKKIRRVYIAAYPTIESGFASEEDVDTFTADLYRIHPSLSSVRFWRVLVTALVAHFDDLLEGEVRTTDRLYDDVMDRLREE
jgi:hypothetical protein